MTTDRADRRAKAAKSLVGETNTAVLDDAGRIVWCNAGFADLLGSPFVDMVGRRLDRFVAGVHRRAVARLIADLDAAVGEIGPVPIWFESDGGRPEPIEVRLHDRRDDADLDGVVLEARSLADAGWSERSAAFESVLVEQLSGASTVDENLAAIAQLVEWMLPGVQCSIGVADDGHVWHRVAPTLTRAVLEQLERVESRLLGELFDDGSPLRVVPELRRDPTVQSLASVAGVLPEAAWWSMAVESPTNRDVVAMLDVLAPVGSEPTGLAYGVLRRARDLVAVALERRAFETTLRLQANTDQLTGLPNRSAITNEIDRRLAVEGSDERHAAVVFIDLDRFKYVNDNLGHAVGDQVLVRVAQQLASVLGDGELLGRFGGDEFVLVTLVDDAAEALLRSEGIRTSLDRVLSAWNVSIALTASVGAAVAGPMSTSQTLLRDADAAMYEAKEQGRNRSVVFQARLREEMLARVEMEAALRRSINRRELEVHYQPVVHAGTGALVACEALVRWRRRPNELLSPAVFVPMAEEVGLIGDIGEWVLAEAVSFVAELRRHQPDLSMAVNLSAGQLVPDFLSTVSRLLGAADLAPDALCLEITEGILTLPGADPVVRGLAALGVDIAIDDFGTGYSSLDYLRRFSVATVLKIDASFVADLEGPGPAGQSIVGAAIVLGHGLGMRVVAEGVENQAQYDLLDELGCDQVQGFHVSRPMTASQLLSMVATGDRRARSG